MAKKEQVVQEDKGALAVIDAANQQMKPQKQVATVYLINVIGYDQEDKPIYQSVEIDDIIGYSGAENWFVFQKKTGVTIYNRNQVRAIEIEYKDAE